MVIVKDGHVDDEKWKGDKPWEFTWWLPLADTGPSYAAREIVADLPKTGLTRTSLREYQGCDWNRHIFWLKGDCFALIDEVVAREPGTYYIESNLKTAPYARGSYPRGLAPRARELLEGNRGMSQAIDTKPDATNLYILTDGSSTITTDEAEHQYINAVMMRQVHEGVELQAGERVTFINLLCGERDGEALNRRVERISPTEGLVFEGETPVVYFGCGQSDATRAVLSIDGAMFVLNRATLATADPARETELESNQARGALAGLADLVAR